MFGGGGDATAAAAAVSGPWTPDDIAFRLALLMVMLVPMAWTDVRTRTVDTALLYGMCGMGAVMFAYDLLDGRYQSAGPLILAGASLSLVIGGLMLAASRLAGIVGAADGAVILAPAAAVPAVGDLPVMPFAVMIWCVIGIVHLTGRNIWYNLIDMAMGRRTPSNFLYMHNKRRGEKFTICFPTLDATGSNEKRLGWVDDDGTVRNADGGEYFVPAEAHGIPVANTAHVYAPICVGVAMGCVFLLLTNFDSGHVMRLFTEGLPAFLANPDVSFGLRHHG